MHPVQWLGRRDRDFAALRRAGRAAIAIPALFAVCMEVIGDPELATFAAFGAFAMLLVVDFNGSLRERLQAQAALAVVGGLLVCLGTVVSRNAWLAAATVAVVGFVVLFAGVVSSVLAGATTSLLLALIVAVSLVGPVSAVPARLAGWGIAGAASLGAATLLWPMPMRDPLRDAVSTACKALAARLRAEVAYVLSGEDTAFARDRDLAVAQANDAVGALYDGFLATPYRPTGLGTAARMVIRLVDEVGWLSSIDTAPAPRAENPMAKRAACAVRASAAMVLERGAALLDQLGGNADALHAAVAQLNDALARLELNAMSGLPGRLDPDVSSPAASEGRLSELITALDPSFRARELSFAVLLIARNIDLAAAAERRSWVERLLGSQPEGVSSALQTAVERATAHFERHSVWLHNSLRGAVGLGLSVIIADLTGVQHSFWVMFGTLAVLRSNALSTGQTVVRALVGTAAGFVIGAALLAVIGTNATVLWALLPVAVLFAGVAPAAISFATGQAGFTVMMVILYNIIQPTGWRVGLVRIEDVAIGCAVSLVVGVLFWPRGAAAALRQALAEAYTDSAAYLAGAVDFGVGRREVDEPTRPVPTAGAARAAAAAGRLDDTFRTYLAERGTKPIPLSDVATLITGVAGLRLAADAVVDLWQRDDGTALGDRTAARRELLHATEVVETWYAHLARSLIARRALPEPLPGDTAAAARLVDAVRRDLRGDDGKATATAIRMIWTGDHLDTIRRLQSIIIQPARAASG